MVSNGGDDSPNLRAGTIRARSEMGMKGALPCERYLIYKQTRIIFGPRRNSDFPFMFSPLFLKKLDRNCFRTKNCSPIMFEELILVMKTFSINQLRISSCSKQMIEKQSSKLKTIIECVSNKSAAHIPASSPLTFTFEFT